MGKYFSTLPDPKIGGNIFMEMNSPTKVTDKRPFDERS
jgi:hypothetical protein